MLAALGKSNVVLLRGKHAAMGEKNGTHKYDSLHQLKNYKGGSGSNGNGPWVGDRY